jgi:hypothetical protein
MSCSRLPAARGKLGSDLQAMRDQAAPAGQQTRRGRIVVLGMHRSGTSCTSELLMAMGAYFGPCPSGASGTGENPHGLFERQDLRRICDFVLHRMGAEWWASSQASPGRMPAAARTAVEDMLRPMLAELNAHEPWFVKEPRLCLLLPVLRAQLGDIVAVRVWRHPLEVAESLRARDAIPIEFGVALWEHYVRASFAVDVPGVLVGYDRLVDDPLGTTCKLIDDLAALGISGLGMPDAKRLAQVIDPTLRRSRPAGVPASGGLTAAQRRLLAAFESGDPAHPEFAIALAPEQRSKLAMLEAARRQQMRAAAYRSLADTAGADAARRSPWSRTCGALRYLPLNPGRWVRWARRGVLVRRLREQFQACMIAAGGRFDADWYAQHYRDVADAGADALLHFVRFGAAEGRDAAPSCSTMRHLHRMFASADGTPPSAPPTSRHAGKQIG